MPRLTFSTYQHWLQKRSPNSHKGLFGHVLVIGGAPGFSGAVHLAGEAALRVGAGAVSLATHPEHAAVLTVDRPELMCHAMHTAQDLQPLFERANVVVLGPGLGQTDWSKSLFTTTLTGFSGPIILDADALTWLSHMPTASRENLLYTPHPGEAARLLQCSTEEIQTNREHALTTLVSRYKGISILKGHHTLIGEKDSPIYCCMAGNPGMSTAGMGDVLTGVIAGLIAQQIPQMEAACLGVLLHAMAGDEAAKNGERGLIASDLYPYLHALANPV